uniref:Putative RALF-LIKE 27 family protein n=1 Tax=Davidia involucrata TaxID=16924 RepID=A0A5B7AML5_DAVIN
MGMELKRSPILCFYFTVLVIFLVTDLCTAASIESSMSNNKCNGTVAECITEEEEFLMESEVSRRLLAGQPKKLSYKALEKPPVCNPMIYGDCIKSVNGDNRPCTLYNRCKRG